MWVDRTIAAEGGIRAAGATDPPVNDVSEKEKEGCGLGPMMERCVFSAGATGPPAVTANIVSDESYKTMNRSASSSSPVQDDVFLPDITQNYTTTDNFTGFVSSIVPGTNSDSSMAPSDDGLLSLRIYPSPFSTSIRSIFPPTLSTSSTAPSDEDSLPPNRRPGTIDSEEYRTLFRKTLNLDKDASLVGSRDRQSFTEDHDSGYLLSQDSGTAAEDDLDIMRFFYDDIDVQYAPMLSHHAELLPANVTTSNVESTSNPFQLYRGEVAKEMTNSGLITDHSSCNNGSIPSACDEDEILSPESSEASSESLVNTSEGNHEVKSHHVPEIGMKFSCEEEALKFYKKYAMEMGFKVRKGKVQRLADKSVAKRYFYCSKEGFRSDKQPTRTKKFTREETRTGCKAMIQITLTNGEWSISKFISEHEHGGSTKRCYIDSCSKILEADSLIQPTREIEMVKEVEAGACARFCDMSYSKHLRAKKSNILQPEDAQGLIDYLKKLQEKDLSLFYTFQVDAECHMTNFFWRDSRSKIDYYYFGDVLILDTTFKTDQYNMICAPFLGLNHHRQQVLFGCAFLLDVSVESFTWLLGTFMEAMGRRQPKTIFTTECPAISEAVELTLPKSQHLICKQFVCENAKQHLSMYYGHPEFERDFNCFLFAYQSEGKFQSLWSSLLEQYNLHENPWLQNIYTLRSKWSYLFCKMTFCAGIKSNQWTDCLSNANVFQNAKSGPMMLWEYVLKYEKAAEHQRREELLEDFRCNASKPMLFSSSPMEKQAASVYTPTMFIIFKDELIEIVSLPLQRMGRAGSIVAFKTKGNIERIVEFNSQDSTITCSCKMFESVGILCAHALKVLNIRNIFKIPPQYILKRWTKSAKDGVVEGDYNGEEIADNSESLCKSKFMHKALNVITKSVAVKKTRKIAERYLDIALKEVDDELKKGNERHNTKDAEVNHEGVKNTSSVAWVDWQEKPVKDLYLNQGETSKGTMEFQIQKKRKNEVREKMNLPSSSMSLP